MIKTFVARRAKGIILTMALATGLTVGAGSAAYAAGSLPADGRSCSFSDMGKQFYKVDSVKVTPVVTHFASTYAAPGTTGQNTYSLTVENRVDTSINRNATGSESLFDLVSRQVGFNVQTERATTGTTSTSIAWSFNEPGYYGIYKGTRRVTGTFTRAACGVGFGFDSWHQDRGTYSTFDYVEEGTVGCGDKLPAGTVRRAAQAMLNCRTLSGAAKTTKTAGMPPRKA